MLKSNKHVFWEALVMTLVIFVFGFLLGIAYENSNVVTANGFYLSSEIAMSDTLALLTLMQNTEYDCDLLIETNLNTADSIYEQAKTLDNLEASGVLTDEMRLVHKKYDVLRTFLWMNLRSTQERCSNVNSVVYLYSYETDDSALKARQIVVSKILESLKEDRGNDFLLIPIAVDEDIASLDLLLSDYEISDYPTLIVNNRYIVTDIRDSQQISELLDI